MLPTPRNLAFAALPAVVAHIGQHDPFDLPSLPFFRQHNPSLPPVEVREVGNLFFYARFAENALRQAAQAATPAPWAMMQAKMAIHYGLQAFLYTTGVWSTPGQLIRREVGRLVVKNAYPRALSFYAAGAYGDFSVHRLPLQGYKALNSVGMQEVETQQQLAQQLQVTRKGIAREIRAVVQQNPNTAIRSTTTGKPLDQWKTEHWQQITWRLGYTTVFDLIDSALAAFHSPEQADAYTQGVTDPAAWYATLTELVAHLATVHETYVAKAIGPDSYAALAAELPVAQQTEHLQTRTAAVLKTLTA